MEIITSMSEPKNNRIKKLPVKSRDSSYCSLCTYINFACTSCLSKVEKVCNTINIKVKIHKAQKKTMH